ncbi:protoheme IX farnesyltransferase [Pseudoroseomonas wenyumeiae]|uniref:Protoheme IX farnesyltransferase n=1 Tax=Teichococcus wenyumeiae TaxID=2478470 RepID=A0A3A9J6K9_9PROT|nr:heme o synthase [Pseudoroseomonas wenyumeiae]RKK02082.1 protoheme IX farnesyltransferase [Pseudoroseomonas wenyumeiae]RMI26678.1 protoheme IX farnesyltransferase [Pseudoroseomonas wenyumeiae]
MSDSAMQRGGASAPLGTSEDLDLSEVRDWFALLKPRVMTLVVFSGLVGLLVAPGPIHPVLAATAILCIAVAAGASGAINMWYDRDIDAVMRRTSNRPIPAGRIKPEAALSFGVFLAVASVVIMGLATNLVAAAVLAGSIGFYVFIYTMWLKRRTPQNIVIGGAAGAFPPMIGWAAVTGHVSIEAMAMFAIVFFWTPPHFWALSLYASGDYQRAGVPMLPVVAGAKETRRQIWLYSLLLVPVTLVPVAIGMSGLAYGAAAAVLGAFFLHYMWRVKRDVQDEAGRSLSNDAPARAAFRFSIIYLFALLTALAADILVFPA